MPRKFDWTPELIERVRSLYWEEQKSPIEIVSILNLQITPGAIREMFHRQAIPVRSLHEALYLRPKRVLNEETKRKLSLSLKGRSSPMKGRHQTEESNGKRRLASKGNTFALGYRHTKEAKQKISKARKRHPVSIEVREKIRQARLKDWCNPEYREKQIKLRSEYQITEETKLKIRRTKAKNQYRHSAETKAKISLSLLGNTRTLGYKTTEKTKKILSEISRRHMQDPEFKNRVIRATIKANRKRPTNPEMKVLEAVEKYSLPYRYNGNNAGFVLAGCCPDFVNINGDKIVIEVWGDYWHRNDNPADRISRFAKYGFGTLILWESHIKESSLEELAQEIKSFCYSH